MARSYGEGVHVPAIRQALCKRKNLNLTAVGQIAPDYSLVKRHQHDDQENNKQYRPEKGRDDGNSQ